MSPDANRAIEILEKIKVTCSDAMLAYWVLPNVILTLSDARAYCDGIFWGNNQKTLHRWHKDIKTSLKVIEDNFEVVTTTADIQSPHANDQYASYELVLKRGLDYVLSNTSLLGTAPRPLTGGQLTLEELLSDVVATLQKQSRFKTYSNENIHHIAFGILVGYPDIAITESINLWVKNDPFMESVVDANIRGARYYACPIPVYSYPRHLMADPSIISNEALWSKILHDYYSSSFHKELAAKPDFIAKMEELKNFR